MVQATFEFSPLAASATASASASATQAPTRNGHRPAHPAGAGADADAIDSVGFEIGWDHAHHRVTPPLGHLHHPNPVHQGWLAGRAAFGARSLAATSAVRQWLALRLQAWQQGQAFEGVQVNPSFLARIDAVDCPVSRQLMTLAANLPGDATVTRLNPAAAYAAGNLVVLSQRVAAAADAPADAVTGLSADEQARLAVLRSFATPLPHAQAALLALRVLPPNRVRVINPVQALQVMLTLQFLQAGYARRLLGLAVLMPSSETRQAFQIFMHTLLARRLSAGQAPDALAMRRAMEDSWADTLVNRRWQRLVGRLDAAGCELLLQRAAQRGLVVGGGRWLSPVAATDGWALPAPGGAASSASSRATSRPGAGHSPHTGPGQDQAAALGTGTARPGKTRSLGSQKLAS